MRLAFGLLGMMIVCTSSLAQNFPTSLVTNENALACKDPANIKTAYLGLEKKDPGALQRTGCRRLRAGMHVSVEFAERVGNEDYHLIRISWRRGPTLWAYSYEFRHP